MGFAKKISALLGTVLIMQGAGFAGPCDFAAGTLFAPHTAQGAEAEEPVWQKDIDEATRDDTMVYNIYVGKPMQSVIDELTQKGWKQEPSDNGIFYVKRKNGYIQGIALHPNASDKNIIGNYRIRFYAKDRDTADEMYMRAEKNFSYNFGRPSIKKGMSNNTWFLNDSFAIIVEYNEYDPKMPLVKNFYPYEIVIKRETGDYKKFFEAGK